MKDNHKYIKFIEFCLDKRDPTRGGVEDFQSPFSFTLEELSSVAGLSLSMEELKVILERMSRVIVSVRAQGGYVNEPVLGKYTIGENGVITMENCTTPKLDLYGLMFDDYFRVANSRKSKKSNDIRPFEIPRDIKWEDIIIKIKGDDRILITFDNETNLAVQGRSYSNAGFLDKQKTSTNRAIEPWIRLLMLSNNSVDGTGLIIRPINLKEMNKLKNDITRLNSILKSLFPGVTSDLRDKPVYFSKQDRKYKTLFKIYPNKETRETITPGVYDEKPKDRAYDDLGEQYNQLTGQ